MLKRSFTGLSIVCLSLMAGATGARAAVVPGGEALKAAAPHTALAPSAVIDKVIEAYGGVKALHQIATYRMEGLVATMDGRRTPFVRVFQRPQNLMTSIDYQPTPEKRYLRGEEGWRTGNDGRPEKVEGFLLDSMILQAARANLPWLLDAMRDKLRLAGGKAPGTDDGGIVLEVDLKPGLVMRVKVDPQSWLIAESEGILESTPMGPTGFLTKYSQFKQAGGFTVPIHEVNFASGQQTGVTIIEKFTVNVPVEDSDFSPEAAGKEGGVPVPAVNP